MPFVDVGGTQLYYESVGEGDPLVLFHGGLLDHTMWFLNVPILAERFRVVTIDLPGHG
jgi:pimeloyl-ACP methyl ester carboxylesterase